MGTLSCRCPSPWVPSVRATAILNGGTFQGLAGWAGRARGAPVQEGVGMLAVPRDGGPVYPHLSCRVQSPPRPLAG